MNSFTTQTVVTPISADCRTGIVQTRVYHPGGSHGAVLNTSEYAITNRLFPDGTANILELKAFIRVAMKCRDPSNLSYSNTTPYQAVSIINSIVASIKDLYPMSERITELVIDAPGTHFNNQQQLDEMIKYIRTILPGAVTFGLQHDEAGGANG